MPKPVFYTKSGRWVVAPDGAKVLPTGSLSVKPHILQNGVELRHCACCGIWLPLTDFAKGKGYSGLHGFCRVCSDASNFRTAARRRVERLTGKPSPGVFKLLPAEVVDAVVVSGE